MNTSAKGSAYEKAFRRDYEARYGTTRHGYVYKVLWYPPRPRQHSTGMWDSFSWIVAYDPDGELILASELTGREFKAGKMSCAAAIRYIVKVNTTRPAFVQLYIVHKTKEKEFCEH